MTNTSLLRKVINEKGLKLSYIAKQLGLSPYGFARKLNNLNEFTASEIEALCKILGINDSGLMMEIFFVTKVDK